MHRDRMRGPAPPSRFRPPRNKAEAERARVMVARLLVKQAQILGHEVRDERSGGSPAGRCYLR